MRLNHLNLAVPDVRQSREFFETYFGFRCIAAPGNNVLAVMVDESGFLLNLSNLEKATDVEYPSGFHIGFMQDSRERVDEIHQRLQSAGFDVEPPRDFHGSWTFYFRAPGGFLVEIQHLYRTNLS